MVTVLLRSFARLRKPLLLITHKHRSAVLVLLG